MEKTQNSKEDIKEPKRLYRSRKDKIIAGVCGGIAEYLNIDPVWVRLIAVLTIFLDGVGILLYIIAWILMPKNPLQPETKKTNVEAIAEKAITRVNDKIEARQRRREEKANGGKKIKTANLTASKKVQEDKAKATKEESKYEKTDMQYEEHYEENSKGIVFLGIVLLLIGSVFLMKNLFSWFEFKYVWALALIAAGVYLIVRRSK